MPKISVIIPVYNAEEYLSECLDSVCSQSLQDIEIICVDDGSTDSSLDILNKYKVSDSRIQVLRQENKYAGAARNAGLRIAKGEFVIFWDADDFFESSALSIMYSRITETNADICICGAYRYYTDGHMSIPTRAYLNRTLVPDKPVFNRMDIPDTILQITSIPVWNKLYRRSFIQKENLWFKEIRNANDAFFNVCSLCLADRITVVEQDLVYYRNFTSKSLTVTMSKGALGVLETWAEIARYLISKEVFPETSFVKRVCVTIFFTLHNTDDYSVFRECVEWIRENGEEAYHLKISSDSELSNTVQMEDRWLDELFHLQTEEFLAHFSVSTYRQLTGTVVERDKKLHERNSIIKNAKKDIKSLESENKNLQSRISHLESELSQKDRKIKKTNDELLRTKKRIHDIQSSVSFKLGRFLTWAPRIIRHFVLNIKKG